VARAARCLAARPRARGGRVAASYQLHRDGALGAEPRHGAPPAAALDLPLREQNALLLAAGFAPIWRETALGAPDLSIVDRALTFILAQQEPYPAFVLDRRWNLLRANRAGQLFVGFLTDMPPQAPDPDRPINLADALIAPDALRPLLRNWREVALYFIRGVRADALSDGTEATAALLDRLMSYPGVPALSETMLAEKAAEPVLTMEIAKSSKLLRLFTTLTTLGTPLDVTVQEIRVECFFPADPATAQVFAEGRSIGRLSRRLEIRRAARPR
jgi:hypothetical protein